MNRRFKPFRDVGDVADQDDRRSTYTTSTMASIAPEVVKQRVKVILNFGLVSRFFVRGWAIFCHQFLAQAVFVICCEPVNFSYNIAKVVSKRSQKTSSPLPLES